MRDHLIDFTLSAFTTKQIVKAIRQSSDSIPAGLDGLTKLHLKHLGPRSHAFLTLLFNFSLLLAVIPSIRMRANPHPYAQGCQTSPPWISYQLIFILCPCIKVLERLLLPALECSLRLANSQHGFRKMRSTTTALLRLTQKVAASFNQNKPPLRTVMKAIDLSKAFDAVNHTKLIVNYSHHMLTTPTQRSRPQIST